MHLKAKVWVTNSLQISVKTDAIAHVVRCFEDENVIHVNGKIDPLDDIATINTELALADLETVTKAVTRLAKFS